MSERASKELALLTPGGVNSPFRSFKEVGGHTIFFARAEGSRMFDIDGNTYIDFVGAWGPAILGHAPAGVVRACQKALGEGPVFGAPHELEIEMAKAVINAIPSIERVRFVNSGTEAVMSAIRLARGITNNLDVIMFEGGYHGHSDSTLSSKTQYRAGVPMQEHTLEAIFNDLESVERQFRANKGRIACVILEPVPGSMGVIAPTQEFLEGLRKLCTDNGALLIFDEVLTGFRVGYGGAQDLYKVKPDLTCLGKVLGGGLPIGAYGGRANFMDQLEPVGDVYQAGTFSGNPVTMAGGIAMLSALSEPDVYPTLEERTDQLFDGLAPVIKKLRLNVQLQRVGSMFAIMFCDRPVRNYKDSLMIDKDAYANFFRYLLEHGVYMPPSATDAACVSYAHTPDDIDATIKVCERAFAALSAAGV
jgi:glutamate-1-semialdehyde 2,1-aminomutase